MSKLNKPTVDGLVEKLLNDKIIKTNEVDKVKILLDQASNGLNKNEIFMLVTTLSDRLDAVANDLITPNGLNYAGFDSVVKEVSSTIVKEKIKREKAEAAQKEVLQSDETKQDKSLKEKAEREKQEKINNNKSYLENFIRNTPGLEKLNLTEEDLTELSEAEYKIERYIKRKEELDQQNISEEEKQRILQEELGITEEFLNSDEARAATTSYFKKYFEGCIGKSPEEIIGNLSGFKEDLMKRSMGSEVVDEIKKSKDLPSILEKISLSLCTRITEYKLNKDRKKVEEFEKTIEANEANIRGNIFDDNKTNVRSIITFLDNIEDAQIKKRAITSKNEDNLPEKDKKAKDMFFNYITEKYLSLDSSVSISSLYERYKNHPKMLAFDMKFEDFLGGIESNLKKHANEVDDSYYIESIIKAERMVRKSYLLNQAVASAKKEGNEILEEGELKAFDEKVENEKKDIQEYKNIFVARRNIAVEKHRKFHDKSIKKEFSAPKLEADIIRINEDREQIIKLSKDYGISTEEAAERYFSTNTERIGLYTRRERELLIGKSKNNKGLDIKSRKTLKKLSFFMKEKNDTLISFYTQEIEDMKKELEDGNFDIRKFEAKWKKLEKEKAKLQRAQKRDKTIERMSKSKSVMSVFDERERKEFEKNIFKKYLYSGKTAYEFLEDFNKNENNASLTKNELMNIIENSSRKYMKPEKLTTFLANEETIFYNEKLLEKLRLKKECAEKQGLTEWVKKCEEEIKSVENDLRGCMERVAKDKETLIIMDPKVREDFVNARGQSTVESGETYPINGNRENVSNERNQNQNLENSRIPSRGIEVSTIETREGIKPNVKAIAKRKKVTFSKVKKAFSKIMELRKNKVVKHDEQEVQEENKIEDQTEVNKATNNDDAR